MYSITPQAKCEDLELLCVAIKNHKVFKELCSFDFHSKFSSSAHLDNFKKIIISLAERKDSLNLFEDFNIEIKAVCGENGSGKTTLLNVINGLEIGLRKDDHVTIFQNSLGQLVSTNPVTVIMGNKKFELNHFCSDGNTSTRTLAARTIYKDIPQINFQYGFASHYADHPDVYAKACNTKFTHFNVQYLDEESDFALIRRKYNEIFDGDISNESIDKIRDSSPITFIILVRVDDGIESVYKTIFGDGSTEISSESEDLYRKIFRDQYDLASKIDKRVSSLIRKKSQKGRSAFDINYDQVKYHEISDMRRVKNQLETRLKELAEIFKISNNDASIDIISAPDIFYFELFIHREGETFSSVNSLSSGERQRLRNIYEIYPAFSGKDRSWLTFDEPDCHLHPEWKRNFLLEFTHSVEAIRASIVARNSNSPNLQEYWKNKRFSFIFTTHSPFMLSDLLSENIIYLRLDAETGQSKQISVQETFCGNIGEMFGHAFFMRETIGSFAKSIIRKQMLNLGAKAGSQKLFNRVSDSILRTLLIQRFDQNRKNAHEKD